jgi:NAD-dependent deacetylase
MRREKFNEGNFEVITMNVDGMHGNEDYVHEVHGTVQRFRCIKCAHPIHISDVMESKANPPKCGQCGGYPRPDVTLFTEALPQDEWLASLSAVRKLSEGDVLIIVGTSSVVYPAANLPVVAKRRGATLIEINPQENTPLADLVDIHLRGGAGDMLTDLADGVCKSAKTY